LREALIARLDEVPSRDMNLQQVYEGPKDFNATSPKLHRKIPRTAA